MHMPLVLTNRRRRGGSASAPAFSPSTLYSSGSQGIWLDPSDLSTMFSDRAGTIPVTTPGTVVGKRLDKSGRGNHAVAPTDAARPTYGVEPKGGRRNLLTWSEDFGNGVWTPIGVTVASNAGTAPDGTITADKLVAAGGTLSARYVAQTVAGAAHTASAYFKAAGVSTCGIYFTVHNSSATFDLTTGEVFSTSGDITSPTITPVGDDGWYRCSASTSTTTHNAVRLYAPRLGQSFTSDGTSGILIWGAQLERDA